MTKVEAGAKAPTKAIDLADLNTSEGSDKGARIELVHPTNGAKLGLFITVLGKHSQVFREIVRERVNKRVQREAMAARRGRDVAPRTAEEVEREALELLVACTLGWDTETVIKPADKAKGVEAEIEKSPTITFKGEPLPFNAANALNVYSELLWLREQVDNAIGDLENFI